MKTDKLKAQIKENFGIYIATDFKQNTNTSFDIFSNLLNLNFPIQVTIKINSKIFDIWFLPHNNSINLKIYGIGPFSLKWMEDNEIGFLNI